MLGDKVWFSTQSCWMGLRSETYACAGQILLHQIRQTMFDFIFLYFLCGTVQYIVSARGAFVLED